MIRVKKGFKISKQLGTFASRVSEERPISSSTSKTINSFLEEIDYNHDIDSSIRNDIESKFKKSTVNAQYRFPRSSVNESQGLPKLKIERRHMTELESSLIDGNRWKSKAEKRPSRKVSMSGKYKILSFSKRPQEREKKLPVCSVTPSPYVAVLKNKDIVANEYKRSTPSPAPRSNPFTARLDRNLL
ncbi:hypothetical protein SteCoe_31375 [Stentor coeruleus]|uniref:Uncharacterized protein n=1 Tax=Stentor coeruleus TaxID=5963 RepID=A0A1R2B1E8_9CILI|nr:hypothetical protein SteCoe_31375 [Stentor coeruleus]